MVEMTFRQTGYDAQASFKSITEEEAALIDAHPDVKEVGESIVLGVAENRELQGHQTEIRWADDPYASHSFAWPDTGRMPEAAGELAVDTTVLDHLGVPHELGQQVTLEWRPDLNSQETTASTFRFTLLPLGVCTPLLFILAVLIPCLCFLNLEKQSVVERLRME